MITKTKLKEIAKKEVLCTDYVDYRLFLAAIYSSAKKMDPSYTYAKYSMDLGLGSRNAHSIIAGKRSLTLKTGKRVADALGITKEDKKYFLSVVAFQEQKTASGKEQAFASILEIKSKQLPTELSKNQLTFFSRWQNVAILEYLNLPGSNDLPEEIAKAFHYPIADKEVIESLSLLKELGYLTYCPETDKWAPTNKTITTGNEVRGIAIASFHQQMLSLAKLSISGTQASEREISAVTIGVSKTTREKMKMEIINLRKKFLQWAEDDVNASELMQVNFQMFPLAKRREEK